MKYMFFFVMAIAILLRIAGLNQSFWLDEATQVLASSGRGVVDLVTRYSLGDFHPPLYHVLLWMWFLIFPSLEWVSRLPSVFFGVGTVAIVYVWGNRVRGHLGTVGGCFLALSGLHVYYSHDSRMYATAAFGVTLAMWMFWRSFESHRRWIWAGYVLGMTIGLGSDYLPWFILPVQWLWAAIFVRDRMWWRRFLITQGILFMLFVLWLPILKEQLIIGRAISSAVPAWGKVVGGFDIDALPLTGAKFLFGRLPIPDHLIGKMGVFVLMVPVLFVLFLSVRRRVRTFLFFWLWLVLPMILALGVSLVLPIYSYFRLLYLLPALMVLLGAGALDMRKGRTAFLVFLIVLFGGSTLLYLVRPEFWREDWRSAVSYLDQRDVPVFFMVPQPPDPYTYYSARRVGTGFSAIGSDAFPEQLRKRTERTNRLIFSTYLQDISDPNRRAQAELSSLGFIEEEARVFRGVGTMVLYAR